MHVGYCEVYTIATALDCFLMPGAKVPGIACSFRRNESSTGTKVPRSKCYTEILSVCGLFATRNEIAKERKVRHSCALSVIFRPLWTEKRMRCMLFSVPGHAILARNEKCKNCY